MLKNKYEVIGDTTVIYINYKDKIYKTLIDTEDLDKVAQFNITWNLKVKVLIYVSANKRKNRVRSTLILHRLIMDAPKGMVVDHINHDTLDNRKGNLRIITDSQNNQNRKGKANSSSGILGVNWNKQAGKWQVAVKVNGKNKHIGLFDDIERARDASIRARERYLPYSFAATQKRREKQA